MLGRYNYAYAHGGLAEHSHHRAMEICYLAKGTQIYRIGRNDYVLRGGDIFLTLPGEEHSTGETPQEKGTLYWIHFLLPKKSAGFLDIPVRDASDLVGRLLSIPHRHFAGTARIQSVLDEVLKVALDRRNPMRRIHLHLRLLEFLLEVLECSRGNPKKGLSPRINSLLRYVEAHIEDPLPVSEMAAHVHLSVSRFKARFKQEIGIPPAEYVLRCRISAAKALLARPGATVTGVAYQLSFSSSQYFATVFKRYTGKPPGTFLHKRPGSEVV